MKVFLTGSNGTLGRTISTLAQETNIEIVPFDISNSEQEDIRNRDAVAERASNCDVAVLAAAIPWGDPKKTQDELYQTNVVGSWASMHGVIAAGVKKVVYISSSAVYGLEPYLDNYFTNFLETQKEFKISLTDRGWLLRQCNMAVNREKFWPSLVGYGQSKCMAESAVAWLSCVYDTPTVIFRPGPFGATNTQYFGGTIAPPDLIAKAIFRVIPLMDEDGFFRGGVTVNGAPSKGTIRCFNLCKPGGVLDITDSIALGLVEDA